MVRGNAILREGPLFRIGILIADGGLGGMKKQGGVRKTEANFKSKGERKHESTRRSGNLYGNLVYALAGGHRVGAEQREL